jgi:hypothetical protein
MSRIVTMVKKTPQTPRQLRPTRRPKKTKIAKNIEVIGNKTPDGDNDTLLDTLAVADWLGVSHQWLELARCKKFGPKFIRVTPRSIRYRKGDILDYLRSQTSAQETAT